MHKTLGALVLAIFAAVGAFSPASVPSAAASSANPKVVIVVGATHSATPTYRTYADEVYAEAIKYTTNVVKVYSPKATWTKVKAAVSGASIVVYFGHGNGWPSPYTYDPNYTTKDGFGLNADLNADGKLSDYENKYYGEPSIRTLNFAPNAVVLLFHLCYASGNSEPGNPAPTKTVAKQRADNYTAAFIRGGARAVIADGHSHSPYYISSLFTTHQTIDQLWRGAPDYHHHVFSFASTRNAGYTIAMDPDTTTGGYYRSLGGKLTLNTADVTGASYAPTNTDPTSFSVPGNASVNAETALWQDSALSVPATPATLPAGTRLHLVTDVPPTASTGRVFEVTGVDDASINGYVLAAALKPRDSTPPRFWEVDAPGPFSPDGDNRQDTMDIPGRLSEAGRWQLTVTTGDGAVVGSASGPAPDPDWRFDAVWAPTALSVPDGTYSWKLDAWDSWNNGPSTKTGTVVIDTVPPVLAGVAAADTAAATFSPNGDGKADSISVGFSTNEAGYVDASVRNSGGLVRSLSVVTPVGDGKVTWDGTDPSGDVVADGVYTLRMAPRDLAGNVGSAVSRQVAVYTALSAVAGSPSVFYPQDGDGLGKYAKLSFVLTRQATVTWQITDAGGTVAMTRYQDQSLPAGTYSFLWYGKDPAGTLLPVGAYRSVVSATDGVLAITQTATTEMNAFAIRSSDVTPTRYQQITIVATSGEGLSTTPLVRVYQPGVTSWSVAMTRVTGRTYKATIKLKASDTGTVTFRVSGYDTNGQYQASSLKLPLG